MARNLWLEMNVANSQQGWNSKKKKKKAASLNKEKWFWIHISLLNGLILKVQRKKEYDHSNWMKSRRDIT